MRWLDRYYSESADKTSVPNLPEDIAFHHPVEQVKRMIELLDLFKWQISPQEVLAIPEAWANDLRLARYCGWIVGEQTKDKENDR